MTERDGPDPNPNRRSGAAPNEHVISRKSAVTPCAQPGLIPVTLPYAYAMARLRILPPLPLGIALLCGWATFAKPAFTASLLEGPGSQLLFCDLDGDHLADAVLIDRTNLTIFFQDAKAGFTRKPQQRFQLADQPTVIWPARLGATAESLLLLTSEGVTELHFTNRTDPPTREQIIRQPTIIPDQLDAGEETLVRSFPLSAGTGTDWPLLLVPVADGLEIWQHRGTWQRAQVIQPAGNTQVRPVVDNDNPGYVRSFGLSLSLNDVNGDERDDLMVLREGANGRQIFTLYLQATNGLFDLEPALFYTNTADWRTTLAWMDLNRDGKLDLLASTISDEPSFVPGLQSGKVLVAAYLADAHGRIPPTPQQVFRKQDWSPYLPLVDVDGDGFMDLVLGYIPIDSRDGVRNMITAGQLTLNLKFHFSRPGGGFPEAPDYQRNVPIYFDHDLIWTRDSRLYSEKFLSLNGDFNGDGKKDLLVRDHSDGISVYFFGSRATGFASRADLKLHCPEPVDWWQIQDLNGDRISDLVVKLRDQNVFRVFLSQKDSVQPHR